MKNILLYYKHTYKTFLMLDWQFCTTRICEICRLISSSLWICLKVTRCTANLGFIHLKKKWEWQITCIPVCYCWVVFVINNFHSHQTTAHRRIQYKQTWKIWLKTGIATQSYLPTFLCVLTCLWKCVNSAVSGLHWYSFTRSQNM